MPTRLTFSEDAPAVQISSDEQLEGEIHRVSQMAREQDLLATVFLEAENGNEISFVVGGTETVLGFVYGHLDPPYYASAGSNPDEEPTLTAFGCMTHHTEYPGCWVIPMSEGMKALKEFQRTDERPTSISWVEV